MKLLPMFMGKELVKWKRMQQAKMMAIEYITCFIASFNLRVVAKDSVVCREDNLPFRLIIYVCHSFTRTFSTFHIGLPSPARQYNMNLLSRKWIAAEL